MQLRDEHPFYRYRLRADVQFRSEVAFCNEHGIPHSVWLEEWSPEDRAKALAYEAEKSLVCSMCGTAHWEWEDDKHAYTVVENICLGCEKKEFIEQGQEKHPGKYVTLTRKESARGNPRFQR